MSRTDKDVPYRVHVARIGRERHDHRYGVCDFTPEARENYRLDEPGFRYRTTCGLEITGKYYYKLTFFPRTKRVDTYRKVDQAQDRRAQKEYARDATKLYRAGEVDGIDELRDPVLNRQGNALWLAW